MLAQIRPTASVVQTEAVSLKRKGGCFTVSINIYVITVSMATITITVTDGSVVIKIEPP
jgi:hypothetical protein